MLKFEMRMNVARKKKAPMRLIWLRGP